MKYIFALALLLSVPAYAENVWINTNSLTYSLGHPGGIYEGKAWKRLPPRGLVELGFIELVGGRGAWVVTTNEVRRKTSAELAAEQGAVAVAEERDRLERERHRKTKDEFERMSTQEKLNFLYEKVRYMNGE
jgi:hypothetical protein